MNGGILRVSDERDARIEREPDRSARGPVAQNRAQSANRRSRLVGRGGVALVMYHIARLGLEFTNTTESSDAADLWVQMRSGLIVTVEVKTTSTGLAWPVRTAQLDRTDVYAFVDIKGAGVWIMRTADLRRLMASTKQKGVRGIYSITFKQMPQIAENAWSVFSETDGWDRVAVIKREKRPTKRGKRNASRTVRRTLADGTVKTYTYAPYNPPHPILQVPPESLARG